jgi:hypothetical protein
MRYVTIEEVVANALTIIPDATDNERVYMRQWAYLGKRRIGPTKADIKQKTIGIDNNRIRKPDNFIAGLDLALLDAAGNERTYQFEGRGKATHDADTGRRTPWIDTHYVTEDNNFYYLDSTAELNVTVGRLEYLAMPVDDAGDLVVPEDELEAIMAFIHYMWAKRNMETGALSLLRHDSEYLMARARSKAALPDMLEAKEGIFRKWNSMLSKPLRDAY